MSLLGALSIGQSGLMASQTAIEVAGNNLANVATPGYHEQTAQLTPAQDQEVQQGVFEGRGVVVGQIAQQVNEALEGQVRESTSNLAGASVTQNSLTQIQSLENELSGTDLSTQLGNFFNSWSQLANNPQDNSVAETVIQQGQSLSTMISSLRSGLLNLQSQNNSTISSDITSANTLLSQIAQLNSQIAQSAAGTSGSNSLRDQRDSLLTQLSQYLNISVAQTATGEDNVYVGSTPLVLGGQSRGLKVEQQTVDGQVQTNVAVAADGTVLPATSGQIGALIATNSNDVGGDVTTLDNFANQLIYQVNLVYSQGQGTSPVASVTGTNGVADPTAALNSSSAGLTNPPTNGSFDITVTQTATGQASTSTINVDLDGVDPTSQTSLNSLVAALNGVAGVQASVNSAGQLQINAGSGQTISFSNDTSGVLASLGVNTFFTGSNAASINVNNTVVQDPGQLAVGLNNVSGDTSNALAVANLQDQDLPALNGASVTDLWNNHVEDYAVRLGQATNDVQTDTTVNASLQSQQQSVSGVNTDQETINLLAFQQAYEGNARFLSTLDTIFQTLQAMT